MDASEQQPKKLQWKWIGIAFLLYIFFYLLPILVVAGVVTGEVAGRYARMFIGGWSFGGIVILAAISGYISKGVTIWEPAIAGVGLVIWFVAFQIFLAPKEFRLAEAIVPILIMALVVFLLSLTGAWLGERAQKLWKAKVPESA